MNYFQTDTEIIIYFFMMYFTPTIINYFIFNQSVNFVLLAHELIIILNYYYLPLNCC